MNAEIRKLMEDEFNRFMERSDDYPTPDEVFEAGFQYALTIGVAGSEAPPIGKPTTK